MDYKKIYDALLIKYLAREKTQGFNPKDPLLHKHAVVPPAARHLNPSRLYVFVMAHELFVLRKLLTRVYKLPAVFSAYKHTCDQYFAKNHRQVVVASQVDWCELEIADIETSIQMAYDRTRDENTSRYVRMKKTELAAAKGKLYRCKRERSYQQAKYMNLRYGPVDVLTEEEEDYCALLDEATIELSPRVKNDERVLGTTVNLGL
jgi:hypothetical protein